jgi:hypothetical protein
MKKDYKNRLRNYIKSGWNIVYEDNKEVIIEKPKKFSIIWFLIWALMAGIGAIIYCIYYLCKKNKRKIIYKSKN